MKKFLCLLALLMFSLLPTNATTVVHYNVAGAATHVQFGAGPKIPVQRLTSTRYGNRYVYSNPYSHSHRYNNNNRLGYGYGGNQVARTAPVSRLDKNYKVPAQHKTVCGGITYYNMKASCL